MEGSNLGPRSLALGFRGLGFEGYRALGEKAEACEYTCCSYRFTQKLQER